MSDQNEKQAATIDEIKEDKRLTERAIRQLVSGFADRNSVNVEAVNLRTQSCLNAFGQKESVFYGVELDVKI